MRYLTLYRRLWGLSHNPFPDHAIAAAGDDRAPFYEDLYPGVKAKMARAFLGADGAPPAVAFLWSLGEGDEARGYGKTRHLLWFSGHINADFGRDAGRLAGRKSDRSVVAAYAAFSTIDGLSLSNLLFDLVRDLVGNRQGSLARARSNALNNGRTPTELHTSVERTLQHGGERWSAGLLYQLCYRDPTDWTQYLDDRYMFSQWHKVRYGQELLRTAFAFLRELGIDRLVLLVDQLEDFASFSTPLYKLRRDFPRLAVLLAEPAFRRRLTFVLTMHPRAARILSRYWPDDSLGAIQADGSPRVLRLGGMTANRFRELVRRYLQPVRIDARRHSLAPFSEGAIDLVHAIDQGRPGHCLRRLHFLLDAAARDGMETIDRDFAESHVTDATLSVEA